MTNKTTTQELAACIARTETNNLAAAYLEQATAQLSDAPMAQRPVAPMPVARRPRRPSGLARLLAAALTFTI